jgi:hypothetical protein
MNTEDLIDSLAQDLRPVPRGLARLRVAIALIAGVLAGVILLSLTYGIRPDLDIAMAGMMFWMKLGYTASIALVALAAAVVLMRPEAKAPRWLWLALVPVVLIAVKSASEMITAPDDKRMAMWLGQSWAICPAIVLALSLPIMATLMFAARSLAPTQLRLTGAVIGLASGAAAATIYCLHCPEATATFVLSWYTLGIVLAAGVGALLGPKLLRW